MCRNSHQDDRFQASVEEVKRKKRAFKEKNSQNICRFKKKPYLCIAIEKQTCSTNEKGSYQERMGKYQSGQMGQTVNLLAYAFGGSNPSLPTKIAEVAQLIEH